jgi:uncharacterized protein (TIGR02118 family)
MLKVIPLMKRAENMSKDEFTKWVVEDHIEYAKNLPGLRKYTVSVTAGDDDAFDSVNELYFDDEAARAAAFGSEFGKAAAADAGDHTSQRVHLLTNEQEQM